MVGAPYLVAGGLNEVIGGQLKSRDVFQYQRNFLGQLHLRQRTAVVLDEISSNQLDLILRKQGHAVLSG
jgi:hypothetical protein